MVSILDSQLKGRGFKSHPILEGNGVKSCQDRFLHTILVHIIIEKKKKKKPNFFLSEGIRYPRISILLEGEYLKDFKNKNKATSDKKNSITFRMYALL